MNLTGHTPSLTIWKECKAQLLHLSSLKSDCDGNICYPFVSALLLQAYMIAYKEPSMK